MYLKRMEGYSHRLNVNIKSIFNWVYIDVFWFMTGCKTKPPKVAHPYVKEYVASYKTGSANVKTFEHGEEFAIGADENGKAVFKDPQKAFEALGDYSDGINWIRMSTSLTNHSKKLYDYMTGGYLC